MRRKTAANLLGALAQAITDTVSHDVATEAPPVGSAQEAAAVVFLAKWPDIPIDMLRYPTGLSHPGAVRLVDRLVKKGLLERRQDGPDRRVRTLHLTSAGEEAAAVALKAREKALLSALKVLDAGERETLGRLASKVVEALIDVPEDAARTCRLCDYDACPDATCPAALALGADAE